MTPNDSIPRDNNETRGGRERAAVDAQMRADFREDVHQNPDDPELIRENIERTRSQMGDTLNRIQYRLDPSRLRSEAEEAVRDATIGRLEDMAYQAKHRARRAQRGMIQKVKDNPIPAALIGLGLGWLMMSGEHDDDEYGRARYYGYDYDYEVYERPSRYAGPREMQYEWNEYEPYPRRAEYTYTRSDIDRESHGDQGPMEEARRRASGAAESARDRVRDVTDQAQEQVSHMGERMQEQTEYLRNQARYQTRRTKREFNQAMNTNPLAVGALAAAAGALIGLAVPSTHMEDEWMGEARERFMHEAEEKAQETVEKAKGVVQEATEATKDAAKEVTDRAKEEAKQQNLSSSPKG